VKNGALQGVCLTARERPYRMFAQAVRGRWVNDNVPKDLGRRLQPIKQKHGTVIGRTLQREIT
jgi:hypothetical protein